MYDELKAGGRYFTLKRTKENDTDKLTINISDVLSMAKEIGQSNFNNSVAINTAVKDGNWQEAVIQTVYGIMGKLVDLDIIIPNEIKIDFDLVDLDKDFNYVNEVKINNQCVVLDFSVKRHSWSSEFIKHFVREYNRNVKDMK